MATAVAVVLFVVVFVLVVVAVRYRLDFYLLHALIVFFPLNKER
jgi:hypothetical protein